MMNKSCLNPLRALAFFCLGMALHAGAAGPDAGAGGVKLAVSVDRADALYKAGETAAFTITLTRDGAPVPGAAIRHSISSDGAPVKGRGAQDASLPENGALTVTAGLDEPGFLQCIAEYTPPGGRKKITARATGAFDPLAIQPRASAPEDFDAFWAAQKKRLAAMPPDVRLTPVETTVKGVELFDVQADSVDGPMSGYLARPAGAKPKSCPAIVFPHAAGMRSARTSFPTHYAARGCIALDFNAHGLPNGKPDAFYAEQREALKSCGVTGLGSRDTIYFRKMFLGLLRALDTVTAQPEWNGRDLVVFGGSQGGGLSLVAGGLDPRVTFVMARVPAFCGVTQVDNNRLNGWPHGYQPGAVKEITPEIRAAVSYYDCLHFAPRIKARVFLTVGFLDPICVPTGIYAAYNQIRSEKHILPMPDAGHPGRPDYNKRTTDEVLEYLKTKTSATK
jgi:cephalosporin-C deacetylase-like acetyl esterase